MSKTRSNPGSTHHENEENLDTICKHRTGQRNQNKIHVMAIEAWTPGSSWTDRLWHRPRFKLKRLSLRGSDLSWKSQITGFELDRRGLSEGLAPHSKGLGAGLWIGWSGIDTCLSLGWRDLSTDLKLDRIGLMTRLEVDWRGFWSGLEILYHRTLSCLERPGHHACSWLERPCCQPRSWLVQRTDNCSNCSVREKWNPWIPVPLLMSDTMLTITIT